jgi:hypothetical protein
MNDGSHPKYIQMAHTSLLVVVPTGRYLLTPGTHCHIMSMLTFQMQVQLAILLFYIELRHFHVWETEQLGQRLRDNGLEMFLINALARLGRIFSYFWRRQ